MTFHGWSTAALDFYDDLELDNSKAFWQAHKDVYETEVLAPMEAMLAELSGEFGEVRIFRPYRDVRFSNDKSPYKMNIGGTLADGGYIQLSGAGLGAGHGYYSMESDQIERYRAAVADDYKGARLEAVIADLEGRGITVVSHNDLKTAPRGYSKDHPRIDLLRHKNLIAWREWPVEPWLATAAAKDHVAEFLRAVRPLGEWLDTHVGPTSIVRERRER